jgi:Lrp/AsnC family leucine-responsive transcriptional regulator
MTAKAAKTRRANRAAGVVRGCRAMLDCEGVGLSLTMLVELKVERHSRENAQVL